VVFGRLDAGGARFIANLPEDPRLLWDLQERESLGRPGQVVHTAGHNTFVAA